MIKVAKFGGSSMADERGFSKIAEWLQKEKEVKAVILSAGGKTQNSQKVTDLLLLGYQRAVKGEVVKKAFSNFFERVRIDAEKIALKNFIDQELMKIEQRFEQDLSLDFVLSRGEYLYANMFSKYYGMRFFDSQSLIKFNSDGSVNYGYSEYKISEEYRKRGEFITGGFYGSYMDGRIKTFTRGGGDFSGSIVAKGLNASEYLNFTDVDGVCYFDPKIANNGVIGELSFDLARILGEFGAGVLHPASVLPLYGTGIKIVVKNTFNKNSKGTVILEKTKASPFAVASKNGVRVLRAKKRGCGYQIFQEFSSRVKIICSAVTMDEFVACYEGQFETEEFLGKFFIESVYEDENCQFFYFSKCEESEDIISSLNKEGVSLFVSKFNMGYYLVANRKNANFVIKKICER